MGNNPITTIADAVTDNRTYYNCPRCNRRVYAYGSFVGNVCLDCPGTVLSSIGNTASMVTFGAAEPAAQLISEVAPNVTKLATTVTLIDAVSGTRAKYRGSKVWTISKGSVSNGLGDRKKENIIAVSTRSVGIRAGIADNTGVDHWWMVIETNCSWYNIQFRKSGSQIVIRECDSRSACDETGLAEPCRDDDVQPVHQNGYSTSSVSGRTMGDLTDWLESGNFSSYYDLLSNNCQHLCKAIYRWI
mmetsp:Transcript_27603/g.24446  ORF Transcript_27603/g.24446 Transcript_27603/m.24446 type:complete len:245 (+) Transcript_27603:53-787(+)